MKPTLYANRVRKGALGVFLLLIVVVVFAPGLSGAFIFDDYPTIVQEPRVHLSDFSWDGLVDASFAFHPDGGLPRPLAGATIAANYLAAGGLAPFIYKATNLAVHVLNCGLLFLWLKVLFSARQSVVGSPSTLALVIALLWAIHPLHVSTVLYVIQRMEMLWVTFAVISLWQYSRARLLQISGTPGAQKHLWLTALAIPCGLLAKESAALIPFLLLTLECFVFRFEAATQRWSTTWKVVSGTGVFLGAAALLVLNTHYALHDAAYATRDFDASGRVLAQLEIIPRYVGMILWPRIDQMTFYYDHLIAPQRILPTVIAGAAMIFITSALALLLRKDKPWFAFGWFFFLATHLLTSSTVPLELAFEHRNYLATAGLLIAICGLIPSRVSRTVASTRLLFVGALALTLGGMTIARSATWGNPALLAHTLAEINPLSTRAAMDLGEQYMLAAKRDPSSRWFSKAVAEFERASQLPQGSIMGEHGLLLMHAHFGKPANSDWWVRMEKKLTHGPIRPQEVDAVTGMVEQRLAGLALDGGALAQVAATVARRTPLSPELYALFATQAYGDTGTSGPTVELFARALASPKLDEEFRVRMRRGILNLGGEPLLRQVDRLSAVGVDSEN